MSNTNLREIIKIKQHRQSERVVLLESTCERHYPHWALLLSTGVL